MKLQLLLLPLALCASIANAQIGGSGVDGPFHPTGFTFLDTSSGPYEFTSIHIPTGVTVILGGTQPAVLLSQGPVIIDGTLDASAEDSQWFSVGSPGPGGYAGGYGGITCGSPGSGPGGGGAGCGTPTNTTVMGGAAGHARAGSNSLGGPSYGSSYPFDLRGGSGGGGLGLYAPGGTTGAGGSGGGTIVLFSDDAIAVSGSILADGGDPGPFGGAGSGGSILIRALGGLEVRGSISASTASSSASPGFVRLDAYGMAPLVTGSVDPVPDILQLPALRALNEPTLSAGVWELSAASVPGDPITFFFSLATASIPLPPLGTLEIDPTALFMNLGTYPVPTTGYDPLARLDLPIPNLPALVGVEVHAQAINFLSALGMPRLTHRVSGTIGT